ncbi:MFS transporter [Pseudomonas lopnurensis]|uniref:MFS transporter n=1 Tax=Pseudomonas lopnurensis TaxID=1477517 RepID=UPI001879BBD0|nr:MFS transporter [Pseudomonas lopnurensis]MBE7375726.1 MFS transporter [Pseudomonas lopnurensis]
MLIVVLSTTLVLAFSALVALYPSAIAPEVSAALGIPSSAIGLQVSLVFGGAMLTSLVGGPLTRRLGPCRASQTALLLLGGGAALMSVPNLLVAVFAALVVGLGYGMTNPSASVLLVRFTPLERQGFIFSVKQTGVPLGGMLAGALAPSLALGIGWRQGLWLLAGLALLGILGLQFKRRSWDDRREPGLNWRRSPFEGIRVVWAHKPLRYLAIVTLCFSTVQLSLSSFTVAMLVEDLDVSLIAAGAVMTMVQASGIAGRLWWGWIADRIGHRLIALAIIACSTSVGTVLIYFMSPAWPLAGVVMTLCLFGLAALGWNGVYLAEVARLAPPDRIAEAAGGCLVFTYGGVLLGLPAFALLMTVVERYTDVFGLLTCASLLSLLLLRAAARADDSAFGSEAANTRGESPSRLR